MPGLWSLGEKWDLGTGVWGTSHQAKKWREMKPEKGSLGWATTEREGPVNGNSQVGL